MTAAFIILVYVLVSPSVGAEGQAAVQPDTELGRLAASMKPGEIRDAKRTNGA